MRRMSLQGRVWARYVKADVKEIRVRADTLSAFQAIPIAQAFSSGPFSLAYLAKRPFPGHPYARAHPNPAFAPQIINLQTGKFKSAWRVKPGSLSRDPVIDNVDPVGTFLELGTRLMVARPIDIQIMLAIYPLRIKNFEAAFRARNQQS